MNTEPVDALTVQGGGGGVSGIRTIYGAILKSWRRPERGVSKSSDVVEI